MSAAECDDFLGRAKEAERLAELTHDPMLKANLRQMAVAYRAIASQYNSEDPNSEDTAH